MAYTSLAFGKHKGTHIDQVPADYLDWLLKQPGTRPDTRKMIEESLERRQGTQAPRSEVPSHVHTWQPVPGPQTPGERVEECAVCHARQRIVSGKAAPAQAAPRPTSGSYDGGGIACPACGAMLDVTLAESQVPF